MNFFKQLRTRPTSELRDLARLCSGAALLIGLAILLQGAPSSTKGTGSQAAATVLGDIQGVPPYTVGKTYPDDPGCWVILDGKFPVAKYGAFPNCWEFVLSANLSFTRSFYNGVFSANNAQTPSTGRTVYLYAHALSIYDPSAYIDQSAFTVGPYGRLRSCPQGYNLDNPDAPASCLNGDSTLPLTYCYQYFVSDGGEGGSWVYNNYPQGYSPSNSDILDFPRGYNPFDAEGNLIGGPCYAFHHLPLRTYPAYTFGSQPSVVSGGQLTLQWSCLPSRVVNVGGCSYPFLDSHCYDFAFNYYKIVPLATGASGSGPGFSFSNGGVTGTQTITVPSPAVDTTYDYTLACNSAYNLPTMTIPVTVTGTPVALPTASINARVSANVSSNHALSITVGQTPNFLARFTNDASDPYVSTEILQYNSTPFDPPAQGSASGWTPVLYSGWTASTPVGGPFRFYARVSTSAFTAPATCTISNPQCDYVDITVTKPPKPTGTLSIVDPSVTWNNSTHKSGSTQVKGSYSAIDPDLLKVVMIYGPSGTWVKTSGQLSPQVATYSPLTYNTPTSLTPGDCPENNPCRYTAQEQSTNWSLDNHSGSSVTLTVICPVDTPTWDGINRICVVPPPTPGSASAFQATPIRVRRGSATTLSWTVSGMALCGVTSSDAATPLPAGAAQSSANAADGPHTLPGVTVNRATVYTLTCTDVASGATSYKSAPAGLIPVIIEI